MQSTAPHIIKARNVNQALEDALWWLKTAGEFSNSRNGLVLRAPSPVLTCYTNPAERVLFSPLRDANPFFHVMESMWMLAGRDDIEFVATYVKQMRAYSDDGITQPAAYGHRWRHHFEVDQLQFVIRELQRNPNTRRAVIAMWDPLYDIESVDNDGVDVPCNTTVFFKRRFDTLEMTVCCRSNDTIWGAYGANAVHFSMLHQFIAEAVGCTMGAMYQLSNDLHVYIDNPVSQRLLRLQGQNLGGMQVNYTPVDHYTRLPAAEPVPLLLPGEDWSVFLMDAEVFCDMPDNMGVKYGTHFFNSVVVPVALAHKMHRLGEYAEALKLAYTIEATDWRIACTDWLRRHVKKEV